MVILLNENGDYLSRDRKKPLGDFLRGIGFITYDKINNIYILTLFMSEGYIQKYSENFNSINEEFEFDLKDSSNLPQTLEAKIGLKMINPFKSIIQFK